jgi:MobA-like NTP transferase domain
MALSLVVLAAGVGSRYGGLKQLEAVGPGGATLPEYAAYDAHRAGFHRVVVVVKQGMEKTVRGAFGDRIARRLPVVYAAQTDALPAGFSPPPGRTKPWGTGHATLAAAEHLDGPFAVINADDFYGAGSYRLLAEFLRQERAGAGPEFGMVGFALRDTLSPEGPVSRAVCDVDEAGFLRSIREVLKVVPNGEHASELDETGGRHTLAGTTSVSLNFWGFGPDFLPALDAGFRRFLERSSASTAAEYYLVTAVQEVVAAGSARVRVLPGGGPWAGLTYPGDRKRLVRTLESLVAAGIYPPDLWA